MKQEINLLEYKKIENKQGKLHYEYTYWEISIFPSYRNVSKDTFQIVPCISCQEHKIKHIFENEIKWFIISSREENEKKRVQNSFYNNTGQLDYFNCYTKEDLENTKKV